ncbi:MAG: respiratory nitrate reductase subunit gamma [Desulfobacteraceae bacterium]|nr:respiratory nitrate reductase subunit gamma [Desulfobacteraceae bacterium]
MRFFDLINGPMVWFSFICFFAGTLYQVIVFYTLSKPKARHSRTQPRPLMEVKTEPGLLDRTSLSYRFAMFRLTVFGRNPGMMIITTIFHVTLILTPLFVLAHNILLDLSIGISFPSISEKTADYLTLAVLACCCFFLLRRFLAPQVRAITTLSDFVMLTISAAPFLTGFLAYHQVGDYDIMILAHMISGEIMIMVLPFTRFIHMIYFFINRFILIHENTLGKGGSRVWR